MPFRIPETREKLLPAKPSRRTLTAGMPPAIPASNISAAPDSSASLASSVPLCASKALLAVTTWIPRDSAVFTSSSATPSCPPIISTITSTSSRVASAAASSYQSILLISKPRSVSRLRALTATISNPLTVGAFMASARWVNWRATSPPTTPRPAMATRNGAVCDSVLSLDMKVRIPEAETEPMM